MRINTAFITGLILFVSQLVTAGPFQAPADGFAHQTITPEDIDPAAFTQWTDGEEQPFKVQDGAKHILWTTKSEPSWDGVKFGEGKKPGVRHLRIAFTRAVPVGSVLARAGGQLSVLKSTAAYPGKIDDDTQWIPATRLVDRQISTGEARQPDYAVWVLPESTTTRALRFTHTAELTDREYHGWLGSAYILAPRVANLAPFAIVNTTSNADKADRINNNSDDITWAAWENGKDGAEQAVSPEHPEYITLVWPNDVTLTGINALWAGFSAGEIQSFTGPATEQPKQAADKDWQTAKSFEGLENQYPRGLGVNWIDFGKPIKTRALRLRVTKVSTEGHPHLKGNTKNGKRIWLGELQAFTLLEKAELVSVVPPLSPTADSHPPIAIHFKLAEPGTVTLVIDRADGQRVRNLVSEKLFPAGDNTVWWDGQDDLGRDPEAAHHGLFHIPGKFVAPGEYHVHGLTRKGIDLRFEFSIYNSGYPAWETADSTGCWLTNHTPPCSAVFVPASQSPANKPMVYLGSYVAEGGHGLAWVELSGKKIGGRGWVGGNWTGAQHLARDASKDADANTYAYVGSAWETELRLTALTKSGDKNVAKYSFANKEEGALSGLAVNNQLLVCSLPKKKSLLFVDGRAGKVLGAAEMEDPRGLAFDAEGRLLVLSGKRLLRYPAAALKDFAHLGNPEVLIEALEDPQHITLDAKGDFYISDRGKSHQVKVFDAAGKPLHAIGHAGEPKAGPYDTLHMNNPNGLTIDSDDHLWVTESDYQPKRVSVWTLDGQLVKAFYGPSEYGGGGTLDPKDKTLFYIHAMQFKLDWEKGTNQIESVFYRPGPDDQALPDGYGSTGQPETPIYFKGHRYWTNWNNGNPTGGTPVATIWIDRNGIAVPVAAMGRANDWKLLKSEAYLSKWPKDADAKGDVWKNQAMFIWSDTNGDGHAQPDEVTIARASVGGITVMDDLAFVASRINDKATRFAPTKLTDAGVPIYSMEGEVLVEGSQSPTSSGGDQALVTPDGWTLLSIAPKPFAPQSLGGAYCGVPKWSYASNWPGLHASHESPAPSETGQVIGTTRILGNVVTPRAGDAGPLWCVNGNMGNMYLFTADGLFVAELFRDVRQGRSWSMPIAQRNMLLNEVSLHDENFWPSITQTQDGKIYVVDGGRSSLVRVDGLETIKRLPEQSLTLTEGNLTEARAWMIDNEALRQKTRGQESLTVQIKPTAPSVDGKLEDWAGAKWVSVDKRGVAANFDSNSKPYDVSAAAIVSGDKLYIAWRGAGPDLLQNSGETPNAPFKTGGGLDIMIGADPAADPARDKPVQGDQRLLITKVKNKPLALLYRALVPGTKEPVKFSSPWRTITLDAVEDITDKIELAGQEGNYEVAIPLAAIGLKPTAATRIRGDLGLLRGNGFQTLQRVYWSNKATGITADVPSEAELTPKLWGTWTFEETPAK